MTRVALSITLAAALLITLAFSYAHAADPVGPKKHAQVAQLQGELVIDGVLDDAAWQGAPQHTGFEAPLGQANRPPIPPETQTFFRVLQDEDTLYFGIRCNEPQMDKLFVEAARQHDAAMWSDDDVEIFLDPLDGRREYYQIAVNTEATQVDLYYIEGGNTNKASWSSVWQAAVHRGPDFWSVEIALPFAMFHLSPSSAWKDNWAFSMSRTRTPDPRYYSQYSPGNRYHDAVNYGTLGPIQVDRARYNLNADFPSFRLEPVADGYTVTTRLTVDNRGAQAFTGTLNMQVLADGARDASVPLNLAAGQSAQVEIPGAFVTQPGKYPVIFRITNAEGKLSLLTRFDEWLNYTPLAITLSRPNYRNSIYATETLHTIRGTLTVGLPLESVRGMIARTTLTSSLLPPRSVDSTIESGQVEFEISADGLPVGEHTLRAEILKPLGGTGAAAKFERIAETTAPLRKLPPGPVVEARVDIQGRLLINGEPILIRGWYGSFDYIVSKASFVRAQLPHSTNFIMGCSDFQQTDMGMYTLIGVTREVDEAKAKLDQPIDEELKTKLRAAIASARGTRNVIGYYISDEPECRGLSPVFLESLYRFMAKEDPYRFCMVVSRDPARYMKTCDVMCPHPYMDPHTEEDGAKTLSAPLRTIHNVITEAVSANDGARAIWCMPQTFSYGGKKGRNPDFRESRWFTFTSIACGAEGIVPFIFNGYWNHLPSRIGMGYVFEDLAFLAPAWTAADSDTPASCDNPGVDVVARLHRPGGDQRSHTYIVAANQSYEPAKATFDVPCLKDNRNARLLVLRENRVIPVVNGTFTDDFEGLGVHVYTTLEVLPDMRTLAEIEQEIATELARGARDGNLLASNKVKWCVTDWGRGVDADRELCDGRTDAVGWMPVYEDRTQCLIRFEEPVSFSRVAVWSPTLKDADLEVWLDGAWQPVHQWRDQFLPKMEWHGDKLTTDQLRIKVVANRQGYGSWVYPEITELGIYE